MQLYYQFLAIVVIWTTPSWSKLSLFTADDLPPLSSDCITAMTADLDCAAMEFGDTMYQLTDDITADMLDEMCTDACTKSIASYQSAVQSACANQEYDDSGNSTDSDSSSGIYRPSVLSDYYLTNYAQSQDECDSCGLQMFRTELSNSYFYNDDLAEQYSSLTSTCGSSNMELPTPTVVAISSPSAASATPTACTVRSAVIQTGDNCDTFAAKHNISTWDLLSGNGLEMSCADFPTSGSLCITGECQTHLVDTDDTCVSLASQFGITITQFITWNPVLNSMCTNLNVLVGHVVCVSFPGNATSDINTYATGVYGATATVAAPIPTDVVAGTNVNCGKYYHVKDYDYCHAIAMGNGISQSDFLFLNPELDANCTNLYNNYSYCIQPVGNIETYPGYKGSATVAPAASSVFYGTRFAWDSLPTPTSLTSWAPIVLPTTAPLANHTRKDCEEYEDNTEGLIPCYWMAQGVSVYNFVQWNPSLEFLNCTLANNTRYCTLLGSRYYLSNMPDADSADEYAAYPSNAAINSTEACYTWYETSESASCAPILAYADISFDAFYSWNPSIRSDCSNLWLNTSYCIQGTGFDNDHYNNGTSPSTTASPASTTTSTCARDTVTAPGPTQTGITCNCDKYVMHSEEGKLQQIMSQNDTYSPRLGTLTMILGVYCQDMATKYDITLDQLYSWNAALGGDCSGLWLNYAYCIGTTGSSSATPTKTISTATTTADSACATVRPPGPTQSGISCKCNKYLMQSDGLYCQDMADKSGITLSKLYELNPALGGDCSAYKKSNKESNF
ncbi:hypothetical protein N7467_002718 [Penicillium canescens]|nr:hypothetical protein N7467_002718 [Penicillium canescens]